MDNARVYKSKAVQKLIDIFIGYLEFAKLDAFEREWLYDLFGHNILKKAYVKSSYFFKFIFGEKNMDKFIHKLLIAKDSDYYANACNIGKLYDKKWFSDTVLLKYEDSYFKCPAGYDKILTRRYGNYMKLPPEDKRYPLNMEEIVVDFGE